jgi:hypothetical protein
MGDFGTANSVLDVAGPTVGEIVGALDTDRDDPFLTPWRRRCDAAVRAAFGH